MLLISEKRREEKSSRKFSESVIRELSEIASRLHEMEESFNLVSDEDLIEAAIYEEMSLRSRYSYLLRLARTNNIKN